MIKRTTARDDQMTMTQYERTTAWSSPADTIAAVRPGVRPEVRPEVRLEVRQEVTFQISITYQYHNLQLTNVFFALSIRIQ